MWLALGNESLGQLVTNRTSLSYYECGLEKKIIIEKEKHARKDFALSVNWQVANLKL